jgi:hypothetical protein
MTEDSSNDRHKTYAFSIYMHMLIIRYKIWPHVNIVYTFVKNLQKLSMITSLIKIISLQQFHIRHNIGSHTNLFFIVSFLNPI